MGTDDMTFIAPNSGWYTSVNESGTITSYPSWFDHHTFLLSTQIFIKHTKQVISGCA